MLTLDFFLLFSNAPRLRRDQSILFFFFKPFIFYSFIVYNNIHIKPLEYFIVIYVGLFNVTNITQVFNLFILLLSATILSIISLFYFIAFFFRLFNTLLYNTLLYNKNLISNKTIIEYLLIIVFIIYGAIFLISTANIVSVFSYIELQTYGSYILSTIYRDSEPATASALTYLLLRSLLYCFIFIILCNSALKNRN